MTKSFLTYKEQLCKLVNEKQLSVPNQEYAIEILEQLSYYSLIGGYKDLFKHSSGKYKYGVTFDELVALYYFDEELRTLFLKYILHVERHMKSIISYYFCEKYGYDQNAYLNTSNYTLTNKNSMDINKLIYSLQKTISLPSHYAYITHHSRKYGNVPLWVAVNAMTFGQVSKLYQYMTNDVQYKISRKFPHMTERQLHQFITVIARCRNVCAHGERLYSFHIRETIPDTILHRKLCISQKNGQYSSGKQDLFSIVIALRYLISNSEFQTFKASLTKNINHVLKCCPHLTEAQLYRGMGFPMNWKAITKFRK
ncbi:MAG: Abi family protein [Lachnospiraceae bacterium]|nr:Abi family protein [Lachnospiraceae bacterium]